jgi:hypothetical protein
MALADILSINVDKKLQKQGISEERLRECLPALREKIAFYREYPDLLVDDMKGPESVFKFRFSQRVFLRIVMRHKYTYFVFPRGFSKSFLAMLSLILKAILFPGSQLFVTTGGKEQAANITIAKIDEICRLLPCLSNEINWSRGVSKKSRDDVKYTFKNGSSIDILAARESSRGQRRTGGVIEEAILVDGDALNEIIIPTTNIDRLLGDGTYDRDEVVNQSQTYITTAGWKNSFPYNKLIEILINSIIFPDKYMVLGGDYELAILEGAVKEDMIDQMKLNGTYDETSFDREYRSIWSGDAQNAFYSSDGFDKHRVLLQAEYEYSGRTSKNGYYILGVDVGRFKCTTEVCVFKITPQPTGTSLKSLVNVYTYEAEDFEKQAILIKRLFYKYKCRQMAIDANGVGAGFVDFMTKAQIDPETGDTLLAFGVSGGTAEDAVEPYKKVKGPEVENDVMYLIKANSAINTEGYTYIKTQLSSGKIKLLIDERQASAKLMETKVGQNMTPDERASYLVPYNQTTFLKNQILNLVQENDGVNIILKQNNRGIGKDKFSAFMYGLLYIKKEEDNKKRRKKRNFTDMMFYTNG